MKKTVFCIAIFLSALVSGTEVVSANQTPAPDENDVCIPGKPCAFTGTVYPEGYSSNELYIKVYNLDGMLVARFYDNVLREAYVIEEGDHYYFNYNNKKYSFEM